MNSVRSIRTPHGTCCGRRAKGEDFAPESPRQGTRMDLTITRPQYDAVRGAKHLPDVLKQALDRAKPSGQAYVLHLTYEEATARSEEHTSELQSQFHLVCRLLLEKKKQNNKN